jgi:uncharacterized protein (TIGR03435 family)
MTTYNLVRKSDGKLGPSIAAAADCGKPSPLKEPPVPMGGVRATGCTSMEAFAQSAGRTLGAPVFDKTGLTGSWNYWLHFAPETRFGVIRPVDAPAPDPGLPTYGQALQDQLGLKLDASDSSVEVLVIDSAERPTEN